MADRRPTSKKAAAKKAATKKATTGKGARSTRKSRASKKASGSTASGAAAAEAKHQLVQEQVAPHEFGDRTRSAALLAWFLEHVWRLDPTEVEDSICDGAGDKGIDGLVVNEDTQEIEVFQVAHVVSSTKTQGDGKLKQFRGVDTYFRDSESIDRLLDSSPKEELRNLIERHKLRELLGDGEGWTVRLVYVTDAVSDSSATDYLRATAGDAPSLDHWDLDRIHPVAERTAARELLDRTVNLTANDYLVHDLQGGRDMAVAIVPATDLVALPGIDTLSVFDLNVRLGVGRTRINRDLSQAIKNAGDHSMFPAFHNGMTLLTRKLTVDSGKLTLEGVSVVNGCQSLLALHENRAHLSDGLAILVKVVQLGDDRALAEEITYRSNNQNPINFRDQRSTDATQVGLQRQVEEDFGDALFFRIREGEPPPQDVPVLDNRVAAQLIMAVYIEEPHRAVRKVALFDREYHRIFNKDITADKLYFLHLLNEAVTAHRDDLRPELAAAFASVRFTILNLTTSVIAQGELGRQLVDDPGRWLPDKAAEVRDEIDRFIPDVTASVDLHVETEGKRAHDEGKTYDPKVVFKSVDGVAQLRQRVLYDADYNKRREERAGRTYEFEVDPAR